MFIVHLDYTDWYLGVISPGGGDREIIEGLLVFSFPTFGASGHCLSHCLFSVRLRADIRPGAAAKDGLSYYFFYRWRRGTVFDFHLPLTAARILCLVKCIIKAEWLVHSAFVEIL